MQLSIDESCRFGMGIDTRLQQARGEGVLFNAVTTGSGGQTTSSSLTMITEQRQLMEALDVSVSASVRYGLASADARMKFAEQNAVNDSSVIVALHAWAYNPASYMTGRRLTPEATEIYRRDPEQFRRVFGDCYIDEIYTGGSLTILYMFRTHDQQTKTSLSAELNVAVNGFVAGGNVSAKFSSATETAERKSELQITAFISGGRGIVNPASMEDSIRLYQNFPATVLNAGVPYRVTAKPWQEFPMPPTATWVETLVRSDTIETCGANVLNAIQYRARIQYILANPQQFVAPDIEGLTNALASLNTLIGRWGQTAKACNEDMSKCSLEGLAFPAVSWPDRVAALDPIGSKREEVMLHDQRAAGWLQNMPGGPTDVQYETDKRREGRWRLSVDEEGASNGGIFWAPDTGAHVVYGPIFYHYMELNGPEGRLGYPLEDETFFDPSVSGHEGDRCQRFEHGELWLNSRTSEVAEGFGLLISRIDRRRLETLTQVGGNIQLADRDVLRVIKRPAK